MKFSYHILSDLNLILESYTGEFEYRDVFACKKEEVKDPDWRDSYNVLGDIRKGSITLSDYDTNNMRGYLDDNQEINAKRKSAILTNLPGHVVFGILLKGYNDVKRSLIIPEVFSTVQAALSWLGVEEKEYGRIEEILRQMKE